MTLYSDLYLERHLISRLVEDRPGNYPIVAPATETGLQLFMRVSLNGGGGLAPGIPGAGAGAAFARRKLLVTPGDAFTLQIGAAGNDTAAGDSILTKTDGGIVICKADRGRPGSPGLLENCVGDVKRSGTGGSVVGGYQRGGSSAGDDDDPMPLGMGGRGARQGATGQTTLGPLHGGGGIRYYAYISGGYNIPWQLFPGAGRGVVEFFDQDPGY